MQHRHSTGFTLVELMVVIAIVGILALMAAPSYRDMIERNRLRGAADDVLSLITNTRAQAVKNGLDARIVTTAGDDATWCVGANGAAVPSGGVAAGDPSDCTCGTANSCQMEGLSAVVPVGKHPRVTMAEGSAFVFDGKLGTARSGSGAGTIADPDAIRLTTLNYEVRVDVTPLGQATLCTPNSMPGVASCP